jgi:hypothetical protein
VTRSLVRARAPRVDPSRRSTEGRAQWRVGLARWRIEADEERALDEVCVLVLPG